MATFIADGEFIDYTPATTVPAGGVVVQGDLIGVARCELPANVPGALAVRGVFDFPKSAGGGTAIPVGTTVYWNAGTSVATATSAGNKLLGKTVKAAADADTTVRVRLFQ
jgi:predicted RecA/RadA family phage recombinase